jgi:putative ABC transport system substrate-binding protein
MRRPPDFSADYWHDAASASQRAGIVIARRAVAGLAVALLLPTRSFAQTPMGTTRCVGVLSTSAMSSLSSRLAPFVQAMRELGWSEGRNLVIDVRGASDRADQLPAFAADLARLKCDVIVTFGTPAALAARDATSSTPIVMAVIGDPVGVGLVRSLSQPGGNVTGNTMIEPGVSAKRLEVLRELLPRARRIGILSNPENPMMRVLKEGEDEALRRLGLQGINLEVRDANELEGAVAELVGRGADAFLVHFDSPFVTHRVRLMRLALSHALPTVAEATTFAEAGGLLSYAPSDAAMVRNAAVFVDKIFKGATPAELPVEQPTKFELVVNMGTARALGVAVPQSILLRADRLIE